MTENERNIIRTALVEARGALHVVSSPENLVGNIITRIDLALDKLATATK